MAIVNKMWIHGDKTSGVTVIEKILIHDIKIKYCCLFIEEANESRNFQLTKSEFLVGSWTEIHSAREGGASVDGFNWKPLFTTK